MLANKFGVGQQIQHVGAVCGTYQHVGQHARPTLEFRTPNSNVFKNLNVAVNCKLYFNVYVLSLCLFHSKWLTRKQ